MVANLICRLMIEVFLAIISGKSTSKYLNLASWNGIFPAYDYAQYRYERRLSNSSNNH
jgi:hypothetical protein